MRSRRQLLGSTLGLVPLGSLGSLTAAPFRPRVNAVPELAGRLGLVSASLSRQIARDPGPGQFTMLEFPGILRDELDLEIADLNTMNFPTLDPGYVERLRAALDRAGCRATNLKMNQKVDMASPDASERARALETYRRSIDAAALLGCHWVRPLPRNQSPDPARLEASFDELIDYAGERGITVLLENFGWLTGRADSLVALRDSLGRERVALGPDTGNWTSNEVRYAGLEKCFPDAVTCDFKAKGLGPDGEHPLYDLERCFDIGWKAGFRGPWNFEFGHADRDTAFQGLSFLRDSLREWIRVRESPGDTDA